MRISQEREAVTAGQDLEVAVGPGVEADAGPGHAPAVGHAAGPDPAVHAANLAAGVAHDPGPDRGQSLDPEARADPNLGVNHQLTDQWKMEIEVSSTYRSERFAFTLYSTVYIYNLEH